MSITDFHCFPRLYCTPVDDLGSWSELDSRGVRGFGLGVYKSNLVMLGGCALVEGQIQMLNEAFVSHDGMHWQNSLPPMPTQRAYPILISVGEEPECLVVASGMDAVEMLTTVEVLVEGQWCTIEPLTVPCYMNSYCFHREKLFLAPKRVLAPKGPVPIIFCEVETLLAHCTESAAGNKPTGALWRTVDRNRDVGSATPFDNKYRQDLFFGFIASFGGCLLTVKEPLFTHDLPPTAANLPHFLQCADWCVDLTPSQSHEVYNEISALSRQQLFAHSPSTKSWVCVGKVPSSLKCAVVLPIPGRLVMIASEPYCTRMRVLKVKLGGMMCSS